MNTGDVQTATLISLTMTRRRRRHGKIPTKSDQAAAAWLLLVNSHGTAGPRKPNPSQAKHSKAKQTPRASDTYQLCTSPNTVKPVFEDLCVQPVPSPWKGKGEKGSEKRLWKKEKGDTLTSRRETTR